jgi:hypothetical protein
MLSTNWHYRIARPPWKKIFIWWNHSSGVLVVEVTGQVLS